MNWLTKIDLFRRLSLVRGDQSATNTILAWQRVQSDPDVMRDLASLGHLFETDIDPDTGQLYPDNELRARAARKSLALVLFARMGTTHDDLLQLMKEEMNETSHD